MKNRIMISALCICTLLAASGCSIGEENEASIGYNRESAAATESDQGVRVIPLEEVILDQNNRTESLVETSALLQLWCEELGDTTYLFTVEGLAYSPDYILRIRVIKDDYVEDKAVYLLKADMEEYCWDWDILEITPTAEGVG